MRHRMLVGLCFLVLAAPVNADDDAKAPGAQRAVLVTGASTGIGRKITERLAAEGFFVYAGARKEADLAELDAIKNVDSVRLDVTKPDEIAAAVQSITKMGRGLYGVVNNAGVAISGPLMQSKPEDFDYVFDVNVYGPYRITQAFIPLVLAAKEPGWPRRLLVGYAVLMPFVTWGALADFLQSVAITMGPQTASQTGFVA